MSAKREHLVATALQLFYRQGFHATGVEQLAREAGVTKRTLYSHFPGKEDLVLAALQLRDAQFLARLANALEAAAPSQTMPAYIEFLIDWSGQPDFHGCAFINAAAEYSALQAPAHRLADAHKAAVKHLLGERLRLAGVMAPEEAANALFLVGEGFIVASQVSGRTPYADTTRRLAAALAREFAPAAGSSATRKR